MVPLAGGILCGDTFPSVWPWGSWPVGIALLAVAYAVSRRTARWGIFSAAAFLVIFAFGASLTGARLERVEYTSAPDGEPSVCQVLLTEKPEIKKNSLSFRAVLQGEVRGDTLLPDRKEHRFLLYFPKDSAAFTLRRGDVLLVSARFTPPVNNGNPDEFDYARYLLHKEISGTAYIDAGQWKVTGHESGLTLRQRALDYREKVVEYYRRLGLDGDELAVFSALTVGDKELLDEEIVETYSVAGASHVLALSGLHVGFIYALLFFLCAPLWKRWPFLKSFLLPLMLLPLWSYAFFTGLSSSVVRAVVMCSLFALSLLQKHKPMPLNTLAVTAFGMLLFNPFWLFDIGFRLSFAAVAAIVLLQPKLYGLWSTDNRLLKAAWGLATVCIAAQAGTAPLVIFSFSRFPTHFLLTGLWIVPCVSLIMYAAVLLFVLTPFPVLQHLLVEAVGTLIHLQNTLLHGIEHLPFASIERIWIDGWELLLFYLFLLWMCRGFRRCTAANVRLALVGLLFCVSYHTFATLRNAPRRSITFYNVRGCPAVHCLTDGARSWLIDADSLSDRHYLQRALSPHWNRLHLAPPAWMANDCSLPELTYRDRMLFYGGKSVCFLTDNRWLDKVAEKKLPLDYLYVTHGYRGNLRALSSLFAIGTVVLAPSLSIARRRQMQGDCSRLGIPCLSLSEKGSVGILL